MILPFLLVGCGASWDGTWLFSLVLDEAEQDRSGVRSDMMTSLTTLEDGRVVAQNDRFTLTGSVSDEEAAFAFESRYAVNDLECDYSWVTSLTLEGTLSYGVFEGRYVEKQATSSCEVEESERTQYLARGVRLDGDPDAHVLPASISPRDTGWR